LKQNNNEKGMILYFLVHNFDCAASYDQPTSLTSRGRSTLKHGVANGVALATPDYYPNFVFTYLT